MWDIALERKKPHQINDAADIISVFAY